MAIAYDSSVVSTAATWSHTCTGSNGILIVFAFSSALDPTAISYNSVGLTKFGSLTTVYGTISIWYLFSPPTGLSYTVSVTGFNTKSVLFSTSYNGVLQSGFPDSSNKLANQVSPSAISTTVVASSCWLIGGANTDGGGTVSGSLTTRQSSSSYSIANYSCLIQDSNSTVGTNSQSITWTCTSNIDSYIISLAPVPDIPGSFFFTIN